MNKVTLIGRISNNLEVRATSTGKSICEFRLAINRPANKDGERVADFINCRVWGKTAENLVKYQDKGSLIAIGGRIQVDAYQDKEGKNRYNTYVLVEELEYLQTKKEGKKEENEFKDFSIKTEVQQQFDYTDEDLPF